MTENTNLNQEVNQTVKKAGRPKKVVEIKNEVKTSNINLEVLPSLVEIKDEVKIEPKTTKKELSVEELASLRAEKKKARERSMRDRDLLNLSEETLRKLEREGKCAKLAKKENIPMWKSRGYEILDAAEHESSDPVYASKSASGGIEIQDNKTDPLSKSVWMVTDKENREILREIEADAAKRQQDQIGQSRITVDGVTESLLPGKLTKY